MLWGRRREPTEALTGTRARLGYTPETLLAGKKRVHFLHKQNPVSPFFPRVLSLSPSLTTVSPKRDLPFNTTSPFRSLLQPGFCPHWSVVTSLLAATRPKTPEPGAFPQAGSLCSLPCTVRIALQTLTVDGRSDLQHGWLSSPPSGLSPAGSSASLHPSRAAVRCQNCTWLTLLLLPRDLLW